MQKIIVASMTLCSLALVVSAAITNPFGWKLEPEFEKLNREQRGYVIQHKRNIAKYQNELKRIHDELEAPLVGVAPNQHDPDILTDKEFYLDLVAAEEGMLATIKKKLIRGENVEWKVIASYVPNFKYIKTLYKHLKDFNAIKEGKMAGDSSELMKKVIELLTQRRAFRDELRSGESPEILNHKMASATSLEELKGMDK